MANWDFTVDSELQKELSEKINKSAENYDVKVEQMYSQISSMGQHWVGEDYDKFAEGTEGYHNALNDLSDGMRMYAKHLDKMVAGTDELSAELIAIINNITGTANSTGSTGTSGATGSGATNTNTPNGNGGLGVNGGVSGTTGGDSGDNSSSPSMSYGAGDEGGAETENPTSGSNGLNGGNEEPLKTTDNPDVTVNSSITVSSGQEVSLNGEKCYFLMRDSSGKDYYVKSLDSTAQVFVNDGSGQLTPYTSYSSDKIVSREDFVNDRKHNMDYQWNITYNNGTSPYDSVGTNVEKSFTQNVDHPDYTFVNYDSNYLQSNATTLTQLSGMSNSSQELPEVVYIAPNQSIKYDKPWDTYDNVINGGNEGAYMIYDSTKDAYFVLKNGAYNTRSEGTFGLWISRDQLFDERTSITTSMNK